MKQRSDPIQSPSLLAIIVIFAKIPMITMMNLPRDIPSMILPSGSGFPKQIIVVVVVVVPEPLVRVLRF